MKGRMRKEIDRIAELLWDARERHVAVKGMRAVFAGIPDGVKNAYRRMAMAVIRDRRIQDRNGAS